jgi:hypothetical protein
MIVIFYEPQGSIIIFGSPLYGRGHRSYHMPGIKPVGKTIPSGFVITEHGIMTEA